MSAAALPQGERVALATEALIEIDMTVLHLLKSDVQDIDEAVLRTMLLRLRSLANGGCIALGDEIACPEELRTKLFPTLCGEVQ